LSSAILRVGGDVRPWEIAPIHTAAHEYASDAEHAAGPPDRTAILAAANARAAQIAQEAQREAEALRERAQAEADQLRAAAETEGFAAGRARAQEEGDALCRHLIGLTDHLATAYQSFCASQVPALASLAVAAATKLLREQLTIEPERIVTLVNEALEDALTTARVTVHLHPEDVALVAAHWGRGSDTDPASSRIATRDSRLVTNVRLAADPTVERGGCWIESDQGEVDATVGGRLSRLAQAIRDDE
jgi:flagellar assembly protein FliH